MTTGVWSCFSCIHNYDTLFLTAGIWFLAKFLRYAFPALFPVFQTEFAVSNAFLVTAFTAMMVGYSLMQFPSSVLSDRLGQLPLALTVLTVAAGALGALFVVGEATLFVLGAIVVAFGLGSHGFRPIRGAYLSATIPGEVLAVASGSFEPC